MGETRPGKVRLNRKTIPFPVDTKYHPQELVYDEKSALREGWLTTRTAPLPDFRFQFQENNLLFANYAEVGGVQNFIASGGTTGGGWWYRDNAFVVQGEPFPFKKVVKGVIAGAAGDTVDALIALRTDGAKHILIPQVSSTPFYFDAPAPPVLDTPLDQPTPQQNWEDIRIFFTASIPVGAIDVESYRSVIYLRKHNPNASTVFTGSFAPPHTPNITFTAYVMKGGLVYRIGGIAVNPNNGNFTLTVPDNDALLGLVSDYRFLRPPTIFKNINFKDAISFGTRVVYWDNRSVYISQEGNPFYFGSDAGFMPQAGDGGIVPLSNVRFVQAWGSMLLAFTEQRVYRILEVQAGVWAAVETALPPPAPNSPFDEGLYRSYQSLVWIQPDESAVPFGLNFLLLSNQFVQIMGTGGIGFGRTGNKDVWIWEGENIFKYGSYDYIFRSGNRFYLIRYEAPYQRVYEFVLTKWTTSSIKRYTKWVFYLTLDAEAFLKRWNLWLDDAVPYTITISYRNPNGNWVQGYQSTGVAKRGDNRFVLDKRIRSRMFRLVLELGDVNGSGDYEAHPSVEVSFLERMTGGLDG